MKLSFTMKISFLSLLEHTLKNSTTIHNNSNNAQSQIQLLTTNSTTTNSLSQQQSSALINNNNQSTLPMQINPSLSDLSSLPAGNLRSSSLAFNFDTLSASKRHYSCPICYKVIINSVYYLNLFPFLHLSYHTLFYSSFKNTIFF